MSFSTSPPAAPGDASASTSTDAPLVATTSVSVKVGIVGDSEIGKTSFMVKYVEDVFDKEYTQTLGVNFMEKAILVRSSEINFSIWDLGGQREFISMLPFVVNEAIAILFLFDLTNKETLDAVREWYRQSRGFNRTAIPILVGTKYDLFIDKDFEFQEEVTKQARRYARAMRSPLVFCSSMVNINVSKIFKIILSKAFGLRCVIPMIHDIGDPILEY